MLGNRTRTWMLAVLAALTCSTSGVADAKVSVGDTVDFRARSADGPVFAMSDLRGRMVVVHFWLSEHEGSRLQLETLRGVLDVYGDEGVVLLGVCLDPDRDAARDAIAELAAGPGWYHTLNYTSSPSIDARFYDEPYGVPTCWVLGPDGEALWNGHPSELPAVIVGLLAEHPPTRTGPAPAPGRVDPTDTLPPRPLELPERIAAVRALQQAGDALFAEPADFAELLAALADVPESAYRDPLVVALTRRSVVFLQDTDAESFAAYEAARAGDPDAAGRADALFDAARRTDLSSLTVDPELLQRRLEMIRRDQERGREFEAYDDLMWVVNFAAGNDDAGWALGAAATHLADDAFLKRYRAHQNEKDAQAKLVIARGHQAGYQEDLAEQVLREILEQYPDSQAARDARAMLETLR